ncbi:zinc ribbon domain-containing protein [Labrys sp. ZIDIC5]|uniref:zinc ribbon domain-containing protein n=1 Tax=Labrys sedimenti TaxID=3106036 RepID=UPI002ACA4713|nr:zinc ribbon domain-containing protein [Labrys sp. ZIDIC5]MDZ5451399.1 zinc ribbon domain-containing protein [Labrys sp. ZIDIC5]
MIIWGSKGRIRSIGQGTFNCPHCAAPRQYEHKKTERWFTLYFIPIFPTSKLGEHIECNSCGKAYTSAVLSYDPAREQAEHEAQIAGQWRTAMIAVACAFGVPNEAQAKAISDGIARTWRQDSDPAEILADSAQAPAGGMSGEEVLGRLGDLPHTLGHAGKEGFLQSAREVLRAGRGEDERQRELLTRIGGSLGMSDAHVRGILVSPA